MWEQLFQELRSIELLEQPSHLSLAPSRAWPQERVKSVHDEKGARLEVSFPGLYGAFGILPDYFTDELLLEGPDREGMRAFLDIFNQRLIQLMYQSWSRYRFFTDPALKPGNKRNQLEKDFLDRLAGVLKPKDCPLYLEALRCNKVALYRRSARTGAGLLELLQTFLPDLKIRLEQFVVSYRAIPSEQFARLGGNIVLGAEGSFVMGKNIKDIGGAFRLVFEDLDYDTFQNLSPGGPWRTELETLVGDYTRGQLEANIRLVLRRNEVPAWRLGGRQLGRNVWLRSGPVSEDQAVDAGVLS